MRMWTEIDTVGDTGRGGDYIAIVTDGTRYGVLGYDRENFQYFRALPASCSPCHTVVGSTPSYPMIAHQTYSTKSSAMRAGRQL